MATCPHTCQQCLASKQRRPGWLLKRAALALAVVALVALRTSSAVATSSKTGEWEREREAREEEGERREGGVRAFLSVYARLRTNDPVHLKRSKIQRLDGHDQSTKVYVYMPVQICKLPP